MNNIITRVTEPLWLLYTLCTLLIVVVVITVGFRGRGETAGFVLHILLLLLISYLSILLYVRLCDVCITYRSIHECTRIILRYIWVYNIGKRHQSMTRYKPWTRPTDRPPWAKYRRYLEHNEVTRKIHARGGRFINRSPVFV